MIIACVLSAMAGAFFGVCIMACFVAAGNADRQMENENEKGR